jgi:saccharopine dehydrogenase-like NADP-dependent oxidoreductase
VDVLLLGVGLQGRAALYDLAASPQVERIIAADRDVEGLDALIRDEGYAGRVESHRFDASDPSALDALMGAGVDVAIDLLPVAFIESVGVAAVRNGVHLVNTFYVPVGLERLDDAARAAGVSILPEFGLDPGIDLVLTAEAIRQFDEVTSLLSYGAGIPSPEAADNPLRYKVSWTLEGVLNSYVRPARVIRDGRPVRIGRSEVLLPAHRHEVAIEGLGTLEAFPNEDVLDYIDRLALDPNRLEIAGRYTLRWPGHCDWWQTAIAIHLLDEDPVIVDGHPVDRQRFLATALEPHLRYRDEERDVSLVRIEVEGSARGRRARAVLQVLDQRDPRTGLSGMSRTVGFTASIAAQWLGSGTIEKRGLLSPTSDVAYEPLVHELARRGIVVESDFAFVD